MKRYILDFLRLGLVLGFMASACMLSSCQSLHEVAQIETQTGSIHVSPEVPEDIHNELQVNHIPIEPNHYEDKNVNFKIQLYKQVSKQGQKALDDSGGVHSRAIEQRTAAKFYNSAEAYSAILQLNVGKVNFDTVFNNLVLGETVIDTFDSSEKDTSTITKVTHVQKGLIDFITEAAVSEDDLTIGDIKDPIYQADHQNIQYYDIRLTIIMNQGLLPLSRTDKDAVNYVKATLKLGQILIDKGIVNRNDKTTYVGTGIQGPTVGDCQSLIASHLKVEVYDAKISALPFDILDPSYTPTPQDIKDSKDAICDILSIGYLLNSVYGSDSDEANDLINWAIDIQNIGFKQRLLAKPYGIAMGQPIGFDALPAYQTSVMNYLN